MNEDELEIYWKVKDWCSTNPELISVIVKAATDGVGTYAQQVNKDRTEWELIASAATMRRWEGDRLAFVKQKISGMEGRTRLSWDWLLEEK